MTDIELREIVRLHARWVSGCDDGRRANLQGAELGGADLSFAILIDAHFRHANLPKANLRGANLEDANFRGANLEAADLREANLRRANLLAADLQDANLQEANLLWADLRRADLQGADLTGATGLPPILPPEVGAFTGFKKCRGRKIVELLIPADAYRSSATGRKCRASKALVVSIAGDATPGVVARSIYHPDFRYVVGRVMECDCWEADRWVECGGGIHFYLTRQEALDG